MQIVEAAQWFIGREGVVASLQSDVAASSAADATAMDGRSASKAVAVCRIKNKFTLSSDALVSTILHLEPDFVKKNQDFTPSSQSCRHSSIASML
jgi:hypothetical protein